MIALAPDVVLFNEYLHDDTERARFLADLAAMGLKYWRVSNQIPRPPEQPGGPPRPNNQVLAASTAPVTVGELTGPVTGDNGGMANFLHVLVDGQSTEIVGVRVPAYDRAAERNSYWAEFLALATRLEHRSILFAGDFNADPRKRSAGGRVFAELVDRGWKLPDPLGERIYASGSRIDHVLVSPAGPAVVAKYVEGSDGQAWVGNGADAVSDHAALVVDL